MHFQNPSPSIIGREGSIITATARWSPYLIHMHRAEKQELVKFFVLLFAFWRPPLKVQTASQWHCGIVLWYTWLLAGRRRPHHHAGTGRRSMCGMRCSTADAVTLSTWHALVTHSGGCWECQKLIVIWWQRHGHWAGPWASVAGPGPTRPRRGMAWRGLRTCSVDDRQRPAGTLPRSEASGLRINPLAGWSAAAGVTC